MTGEEINRHAHAMARAMTGAADRYAADEGMGPHEAIPIVAAALAIQASCLDGTIPTGDAIEEVAALARIHRAAMRAARDERGERARAEALRYIEAAAARVNSGGKS